MTRHVTLIYNAKAGAHKIVTPEQLIEQLHLLGYQPVYAVTDSEEDLKDALQDVQNTVFVAGGDGTIRTVARYLVGRDVALGIIPMGTANNVAHMLDITLSPLDLYAYTNPTKKPFDVGIVQAPWGEDLFLEACGCGIFAEILAEYDPQAGKNPLRVVQALGNVITGWEPDPLGLLIDDEYFADQPYALLEMMNTKATGPRLRLATEADPHDGLLELVTVPEADRELFVSYVTALATDTFSSLDSVQTKRCKQVVLPYRGQMFHIDGEVRGGHEYSGGRVTIKVWPAALQVLLPGSDPQ